MKKNVEELKGDLRLVESNLTSAQAHLIALRELNAPSVQRNISQKIAEIDSLFVKRQFLLSAIARFK